MKERKPTQQGRVAAMIREAILSGRILPNERLIETELADMFGISRTPIRAALRELEESGWVKTEKNRGAKVIAVSPRDVIELFAVRSVLEGFAAGEACENASEEDILRLEVIHGQMLNREPEDNEILRELNMQFHRELCSLSRNGLLIRLIEDLWQRSEFFRRSVWYPATRWKRSIEDHGRIVECLKARDRVRATDIIRRHITYASGLIEEHGDVHGIEQ